MDNYDKAGAAFELEEIATERAISKFAGAQLSNANEVSSALNECEPIRGGEPVAWRLSRKDPDTGTLEEIVAAVQGIIIKKDLPPIERKLTAGAANLRYLRQSVALTGFHTPTFSSALTEVMRLHTLFIRAVGEQKLDACTMISHYEGCSILEMGNRYLTPAKEAPNSRDLPLAQEVYPRGYIAKAKGAEYIHTEDNQVLYMERTGGEGDYNFVSVNPVAFQIGDIVEAQISIIAVPLRDKRFKTMAVMRSLTLFDGSFAQRAAAATQLTLVGASVYPAVSIKLKRKVGYEREVMAETRYKMAKMSIDEEETARTDMERREEPCMHKKSSADTLD